jgi:hypothetical protein
VTDEAAHPFRLSRRGLLTGAAALAGATAGLTSARAATAAPAGLAVTWTTGSSCGSCMRSGGCASSASPEVEPVETNHAAGVIAQRTGLSPEVRVIRLRHRAEHTGGEPTARNWQHRWVVKMLIRTDLEARTRCGSSRRVSAKISCHPPAARRVVEVHRPRVIATDDWQGCVFVLCKCSSVRPDRSLCVLALAGVGGPIAEPATRSNSARSRRR